MQFNSNSDFPGSNIPPEQWNSIASPPTPFDPAEFIPCACITTRVLIRSNSRLLGGGVGGAGTGVSMGDTKHVFVAGVSCFVKTAKGVLIRTPTLSVMNDSGNGGGGWSDSSDEEDSSDDDDYDDMMDSNNANNFNTTNANNMSNNQGGWQQNNNQASHAMSMPQSRSTNVPSNLQQQQQLQQSMERAYWLRRPLRTAIYGQVRYGIVLQKLNPPIQVMQQNDDEFVSVEWEATEEAVAVKEMSWEHIRAQKDRLAEDPIKEVAAMQYLSRWLQTEQQKHTMQQLLNSAGIGGLNLAASPSMFHGGGGDGGMNPMAYAANTSSSYPLQQAMHQAMTQQQQQPLGPYRVPLNMLQSHIMMPVDLLTDNRNLYSIMPYCTGGELFEVLERKSRFSEPEARFWMRQILQGLACLKEAGVSHRDMSLENLLVHDGNVLVIDMGMCLRIPYLDPLNKRQRLLIRPQGTCGKWHYMSPEICKNKQPFDGHAVDLWAAGVILFLMLTGFPPWEKPILTDERFKYMSNGYLVQMLTEWKVGLSADAMDLLQRMFWLDPTDRLSLEQVWAHPWMMNGVAETPY